MLPGFLRRILSNNTEYCIRAVLILRCAVECRQEVNIVAKYKAVKQALEELARAENVSVAEIRRDIQEAIDAAWNDPQGKAYQDATFPNGKPSVEQFVETVAAIVRLAN